MFRKDNQTLQVDNIVISINAIENLIKHIVSNYKNLILWKNSDIVRIKNNSLEIFLNVKFLEDYNSLANALRNLENKIVNSIFYFCSSTPKLVEIKIS